MAIKLEISDIPTGTAAAGDLMLVVRSDYTVRLLPSTEVPAMSTVYDDNNNAYRLGVKIVDGEAVLTQPILIE